MVLLVQVPSDKILALIETLNPSSSSSNGAKFQPGSVFTSQVKVTSVPLQEDVIYFRPSLNMLSGDEIHIGWGVKPQVRKRLHIPSLPDCSISSRGSCIASARVFSHHGYIRTR